jgi:hypothetical protein
MMLVLHRANSLDDTQHDAGPDKCRRLRVLPLGDSITSGGGYPVHFVSEDTRKEETEALMMALDADANGHVSEDEVNALLGEHEGLSGVRADVNNDGTVTADEVADVIVPILFGVAVRAVSYRPHLERILIDAGYQVSIVGTSCQECIEGNRTKKSGEPQACAADAWLAWHGCDGGYTMPGFIGYWAWSAEHVVRGHPNQKQRGTLADWLSAGNDTLAYDVALVHLGTNDLAAHRGVEDIVETLDHIVRLLHQVVMLNR